MNRWWDSKVVQQEGPQGISSDEHLVFMLGESENLNSAGKVPSILLNDHVPQREVDMGMGKDRTPHLSRSQFPHASPECDYIASFCNSSVLNDIFFM